MINIIAAVMLHWYFYLFYFQSSPLTLWLWWIITCFRRHTYLQYTQSHSEVAVQFDVLRIWPFRVTWRHRSRDIPHYVISYWWSLGTKPISL